MTYAEGTTVAVEKSISEIVTVVKKHGAQRIAQLEEPDGFTIQFFMNDRMIRFRVSFRPWTDVPQRVGNGPWRDDARRRLIADQRKRQRARALLLVVKAKLESVESEVETFEEAFLANVVMADGATLYERVREPIALEYQAGKVQPMRLEGPR